MAAPVHHLSFKLLNSGRFRAGLVNAAVRAVIYLFPFRQHALDDRAVEFFPGGQKRRLRDGGTITVHGLVAWFGLALAGVVVQPILILVGIRGVCAVIVAVRRTAKDACHQLEIEDIGRAGNVGVERRTRLIAQYDVPFGEAGARILVERADSGGGRLLCATGASLLCATSISLLCATGISLLGATGTSLGKK